MSLFDDILNFHRTYAPKPTDPKQIWCIDVPLELVKQRLGIARERPGFAPGLPSLALSSGLPVFEWFEWAYQKDLRLGNLAFLPPVPPERGVWILFQNGSYAKVEGF